jgi:hypothetical protein
MIGLLFTGPVRIILLDTRLCFWEYQIKLLPLLCWRSRQARVNTISPV